MDSPRGRRSAFSWNSLKKYDLFPKFDSDVAIKSKAGGCVTVLAVTAVLLLFLSETYYYFENQRMDMIVVDSSRPTPMDISFDIIFPYMNCDNANVDLVDDDDHPIPVYHHHVKKFRINPMGEDLKQAAQRKASNKKASKSAEGYGTILDTCSPCGELEHLYDSELCCDCVSVLNYYQRHELEEAEAYTHPSCIIEHSKALAQSLGAAIETTEGCRIAGVLTVPRARANFHIAAGFKNRKDGGSAHRVPSKQNIEEMKKEFRVQHVIRHLRFGADFEGQANPLEGHELYTPGLLRHIYLIKLVPTTYDGGWLSVHSYQYTFAPHTEKVDTSQQHWHLPGVYFRYDFTPMMALISTRYSHISTYITRLCALAGGLWVVLGIVYRISNKVAARVNTKKQQ